MATYSDREVAEALVQILDGVPWEAVNLAQGYLAVLSGSPLPDAARAMYERGPQSLRRSKELLERTTREGFLPMLTRRERTGSAENPVTKLFPAAITEQRFLEQLDALREARPSVDYSDDRQAGHTLKDFTLCEGDLQLPINIKNAGTRFRLAAELVGLEPDDCIPIPAYKAYAAIESQPNLLYVVSVDYGLIEVLATMLPKLFTRQEEIAWDVLNGFVGANVRKAEDAFVAAVVRKHWTAIQNSIALNPFHVVSARKAIRILQTQPKRTPGLGLKAWGTCLAGRSTSISRFERIRRLGKKSCDGSLRRASRTWSMQSTAGAENWSTIPRFERNP